MPTKVHPKAKVKEVARPTLVKEDTDGGFRLHSRISRHGLSSTTFTFNSADKGCYTLTIIKLYFGFIVGGYFDNDGDAEEKSDHHDTTSCISNKRRLCFFALSGTSSIFKLKLNSRPMQIKGHDKITINVNGNMMITSSQTLELLASECLLMNMESDPFCLQALLSHFMIEDDTTKDQCDAEDSTYQIQIV